MTKAEAIFVLEHIEAHNGLANEAKLMAIEALKQQEIHAEWLHEQLALPLSDSSKECVRCSRCLTHWDNESNYCPNCGADMRGDEAK